MEHRKRSSYRKCCLLAESSHLKDGAHDVRFAFGKVEVNDLVVFPMVRHITSLVSVAFCQGLSE